MPQEPPEFGAILRTLDSNSVRFVVIGGLAMILHGATYVTFDCDLAVSADPEQAASIVAALAPFRPFPPQFGSAENFVWDERSIVGSVISLVTDLGHLDLIRAAPGLPPFEELWSRSEDRTVAGIRIRVCSLDDLILMKEAANRTKDRNHLLELRELRRLRDDEP